MTLGPWLEIITQDSQNNEKNCSRLIKILSTQKEHKARIFPKSKKLFPTGDFKHLCCCNFMQKLETYLSIRHKTWKNLIFESLLTLRSQKKIFANKIIWVNFNPFYCCNLKNFILGPFWPKNFKQIFPPKINFKSSCYCHFCKQKIRKGLVINFW